MVYKIKALQAGNAGFMMLAVEEIVKNPEFLATIRRASRDISQPARYDGLQRFSPPRGHILIDGLSAGEILNLMCNGRPKLLEDFMRKVHKRNPFMYTKTDKSGLIIPISIKPYGNFQFTLDITEYSRNSGDFSRVLKPLELEPQEIFFGLERIAHFSFAPKNLA